MEPEKRSSIEMQDKPEEGSPISLGDRYGLGAGLGAQLPEEGADVAVAGASRTGWLTKLGLWVKEKGLSAWYFPAIALVLVLVGNVRFYDEFNPNYFSIDYLIVPVAFQALCVVSMVYMWRIATTEKIYRFKLLIWGATVLCLGYVWYMGAPSGSYDFALGSIYVEASNMAFPAVLALALLLGGLRKRLVGYMVAAALCFALLVVLLAWQVPSRMVLVVAYVMAVMVAQAFLERFFPRISSSARLVIALVASLAVVAIMLFDMFPWYGTATSVQSFLTTGKSDPFNSGWEYLQVDKLLAGSRLIGSSDTLMYHNYYALTPRGWWWSFPILNTIVVSGRLLGLAIGLLCVCLVALLVRAVLKSTPRNRPIVTALAGMIAVQMTATVLMNFNLFPISNLGMPFFGQGTFTLLLNCLALGVIAGLRREELEAEAQPVQPAEAAPAPCSQWAEESLGIQ